MKRQGEEQTQLVLSEKRQKHEIYTLDVIKDDDKNKQLLPAAEKRTSKLQSAILRLSGHSAEVNCCKFHPNGESLVSAGFDRQIMFWNVYGEEVKSFALLKDGHKGAVLDVTYSPNGDRLYTTSTDKSVIIWDSATCARLKKLQGHTGIVNACSTPREYASASGAGIEASAAEILASVSDDRTAKVWDTRQRPPVATFKDDFQLTSVTFNASGSHLFVGGIDNQIKCYDLRKKEKLYTLSGHLDTVTGLSLSPDGNFILSNSMDNTLRTWDIRPFVLGERHSKTFVGVQHNFEKNLLKCSWSPDGKKISAGSSDRMVNVWDVYSQKLLYKLPGHNGSVNEVAFHPNEPIILSCSSDRTMFLGEIE